MDMIQRYESSPFWALIGIKVLSIEQQQARIKLKVTKDLLNGNQILHGGVLTALLDAAMGINLKLKDSEISFATISLTTQYMKAVSVDETLYATAEVVQYGRSIASMQAYLFNEKDELISMGVGTFKLNRPRS
jgi:uncharacterized protein (TIGR00369 family)